MNELPESEPPIAGRGPVVILAIAAGGEHLERVPGVRCSRARRRGLVARGRRRDGRRQRRDPAGRARRRGRRSSEPAVSPPAGSSACAAAAHGDTNIASASALADRGHGARAVRAIRRQEERLRRAGRRVAGQRSARLRPRLSRAVGPCVYLRRDALELVGGLDEQLELRPALEIDFAAALRALGTGPRRRRRRRGGAAGAPAPDAGARAGRRRLPARLRERYPYLSSSRRAGGLGRARAGARGGAGARQRLSVTHRRARPRRRGHRHPGPHPRADPRARAHRGAASCALLVRAERIDRETLELLAACPQPSCWPPRSSTPPRRGAPSSTARSRRSRRATSRSRSQLGERFVLSQLDLIAYRNPGYFADADALGGLPRAPAATASSAAERVVVFSHHTRRELLSDALVEEARIRVVPPGLDHRVTAASRAARRRWTTAQSPASRLPALPGHRLPPQEQALRAAPARGAARATTTGRAASCSPARTSRTAPRGSSSDAFLDEHPSCARRVCSLGAVERAGEGAG